VRVVTATRSRDVRFNQLEAKTGARIRYRKVSDQSGEDVPAEKIQKGYEVSPGKYVVVENEEIESLQPKASHTIDIEEFVDLDQIDPIYFENPYYLAPDNNAAKPYRLLVEAMEKLNKVAIGRIVLRSKERLVAIRPLDGVLCIETMRYADEIVARDELVPETDAEPNNKERAMAAQLVESLSVDTFEPEKFHDEYREQLLELIEQKAAGKEIVATPETEQPAKVLDLVAALEQSLAKAKGKEPGAEVAAEADDEPAEKKPARRRTTRARKTA
jgi:DNA end-binding protein Ku